MKQVPDIKSSYMALIMASTIHFPLAPRILLPVHWQVTCQFPHREGLIHILETVLKFFSVCLQDGSRSQADKLEANTTTVIQQSHPPRGHERNEGVLLPFLNHIPQNMISCQVCAGSHWTGVMRHFLTVEVEVELLYHYLYKLVIFAVLTVEVEIEVVALPLVLL